MSNLHENAANGMWAFFNENKTSKNFQHDNSFLGRQMGQQFFGYEKEQVRQTIMKQESIFKIQVQELHRLYGRQKELMNEMRSRELMTSKSSVLVDSRNDIVQSSSCSSKKEKNGFDLELPADAFIKNECNRQEGRTCGASKRTYLLADLNEPICLDEETHMQNVHTNLEERDLTAGKQKCDYRDFVSGISTTTTYQPQRKRRIFGVEISEWNPNSSIDASITTPNLNPVKFDQSSPLNKNSRAIPSLRDKVLNGSDCVDLNRNLINGLPNEEIKEKEINFYQMSLDSLQNNSPQFFNKVGGKKIPPRASINETYQNNESNKKDSESERLNSISGLRNQVDLNLSLIEEESPPLLSLPKAILKIASTEIDLECESSLPESRDTCEKFDRIAAEALIAISSSQPLESSLKDSLLWFTDIVSGNHKLGQLITACEQDEESFPEGMDYYEYMTLNLKQDHQDSLNNPQNSAEKTTEYSLMTKRARRGKRKDFQRDVLPGLVSLSRHEVREDLEIIKDVFNTGKKRAGKSRNNCSASSALQRLIGWGRRLPRQRSQITACNM